jgi:hypothetical protein
MHWYLLAVKNGEIEASDHRVDARKVRTASGLAFYEGETLTISKGDYDTPDFSAVGQGDHAMLTIVGSFQPKPDVSIWMDEEASVVAVLTPATATIDKAQSISNKKIKVRYRLEKTEVYENFAAQEKAAFLAEHAGCTLAHFGMGWFLNPNKLVVKDGVVLDRATGREPEGIVYYQ